MVNVVEDFCPQWSPDGDSNYCSKCARTFSEHMEQHTTTTPRTIEEVPHVHQPWCATMLLQDGKHFCNCLQTGQKKLILEGQKAAFKPCLQWRPIHTGHCMCGLSWILHSDTARNGYVYTTDYHPTRKQKDELMTNEEVIAWLLQMGKTTEERVAKIDSLLRNAAKDNMIESDQLLLTHMKAVLINQVPKSPNDLKEISSLPQTKTCSSCGERLILSVKGDMCKGCIDLMLFNTGEIPAFDPETDTLDAEIIDDIVDTLRD